MGKNHLFDGDLFDFNIKKIKYIIKNSNQPLFNYVIGIYGHSPYKRDLAIRPDVIKTECPNQDIKNIANQFYYRTKALAKYIDELIEIDPKSIIYITSDHIPGIVSAKINYKYLIT